MTATVCTQSPGALDVEELMSSDKDGDQSLFEIDIEFIDDSRKIMSMCACSADDDQPYSC